MSDPENIQLCFGWGCPQKNTCFRYTAPVRDIGDLDVMEKIPYNFDLNQCDYYWPYDGEVA